MKDMYPLFKCRNCGQKFAGVPDTCSVSAQTVLMEMVMHKEICRTHRCSEETRGLADLVGVSESSAV